MLATIAERFANGKLKTVRDAIQIDPLYAFSLDLSTPVRKCRNPLFFPGSTSMFFFFQGVSAVELEVHYLRGGLAHALLLPRETPHRYSVPCWFAFILSPSLSLNLTTPLSLSLSL